MTGQMTFDMLAGLVVLIVVIVLGGEMLHAHRRRQRDQNVFDAADWRDARSKELDRQQAELLDVVSRERERWPR